MENAADLSVARSDKGRVAVLTGDWTAVALGDAGVRLDALLRSEQGLGLDLTQIGRCDTAGAFAIVRASEGRTDPKVLHASARTRRLLELVGHGLKADPVPVIHRRSVQEMLERLGRGLVGVGADAYATMAFTGHLLAVVGRLALRPHRIRWAPIFAQAELAGLDAIPIVAITTFFIGAVVGFLGANELASFGAQVFAVELVCIAVLREFNIVITAVLLAGRSASSFAAEIGSMKMNQEIDAMRVMGVDPFEALVLPRFAALLITIPLLTFVATIAGLAGGMLVCWVVLDLSPAFFLQRMLDNVGISNLWVALSKGPVMAIVIAGIGCRQGMEVGGDVASLGRRVTAAVVHAIFSIILIDALFALLYMELKV
jgi:phospholipid/cholesterol/gamma-HCH transport system permease protein